MNEGQQNAQAIEYDAVLEMRWIRDCSLEKSAFYRNLWFSTWMMLPLIVILIVAGEDSCDGGAKAIIYVSVALKVFSSLIMGFIFLMLVRKRVLIRDSVGLIKIIYMLLMVGWHIYVVVAFFSTNNDWYNNERELWIGHLLLVIEAIVIFVMASCVCLLFWIIMVFICYLMRKRSKEKKQNMKIKDMILNAASLRLNAADFTNDDVCPICFDSYKENEKIIRLPCDQRHHFHSECIGEWIQTKTNWPICKQEFNEQSIKQMRDVNVERSNNRQGEMVRQPNHPHPNNEGGNNNQN